MKSEHRNLKIPTINYKLKAKCLAGQAILELVISMGIFIVVLSAVVGAFMLSTKSKINSSLNITYKTLAQEYKDEIVNVSRGSWDSVYYKATSSANKYYVATSSGNFVIATGTESIALNGVTFTRYAYFDNAYRSTTTQLYVLSSDSNAYNDKSARKVVVFISSSQGSYQSYFYLTRWVNKAAYQASWNGAVGTGGPVSEFKNNYFSISSTTNSTTSVILAPAPY